MSDDPQGIELSGRPAVTKMSKKPLYVVAVMLLILAAALVWSVNFAHNPKEKEEQKKVEVPTETRPLLGFRLRDQALRLRAHPDVTAFKHYQKIHGDTICPLQEHKHKKCN